MRLINSKSGPEDVPSFGSPISVKSTGPITIIFVMEPPPMKVISPPYDKISKTLGVELAAEVIGLTDSDKTSYNKFVRNVSINTLEIAISLV